jgi:hypothetical protein
MFVRYCGSLAPLQPYHVSLQIANNFKQKTYKCIGIITDEEYTAPTKTTALDPTTSAHTPAIAKQDQNNRAFMLLTLATSYAVSFEAIDSRKLNIYHM